MDAKKPRDSRFELLRIIAMFMIVSFHLTLAMPDNGLSAIERGYLKSLGSWGLLGVNLFVLISCYFSFSYSKDKDLFDKEYFITIWKKKVRGIIIQTAFYILSFFILLAIKTSVVDSLKVFTVELIYEPLFMGFYWFVTAYIILQFAIPLIRRIPVSRNTFILNNLLLFVSSENTNFCIVADAIQLLLTASFFLHIIKLPKLRAFFERNALRGFIGVTGLLIAFIFLKSFMYAGTESGNEIVALLDGFSNPAVPRLFNRYSYFMVIDSVFLFFVFLKMKSFSNRFINSTATSMLGVYLFHENVYSPVKGYTLSLFESLFSNSCLILIFGTIAIMIAGVIVEQIRKGLFWGVEKIYTRSFNNGELQ